MDEETNMEPEKQKEQFLYNYGFIDDEDRMITFPEFYKALSDEDISDEKFQLGFPTLDSILEGLGAGRLVVVSGEHSNGKTELCKTFLTQLSQDGIPCAFFTFEVLAKHFLKSLSFLPDTASIPRRHTKWNMKWLETRIKESVAKYDTRMVFIDGLQGIIDYNVAVSQNLSSIIAVILSNLKDLAISLNLTIFLVAHIRKANLGKDDIPKTDDLRDSNALATEPDVILFTKREKVSQNTFSDTGRAWVAVAKNRINGKTLEFSILKQNSKFIEES